MRLLGIHAPRRRNRVREILAWAARAHHRTQAFPPEDPRIAVVLEANGTDLHLAYDAGGSIAAVDGEVYNLTALRTAENLRPDADPAALALSLWKRHGLDGLRMIDGQAATIIWDASSEQLILSRDRTGIPPLFYVAGDEGVAFSTDIKTLLALGCGRDVDTIALDAFLSFGYIPAPWTLLSDVRKVPASHAIVLDGGMALRRHWRPVQQPKLAMNRSGTVAAFRRRVEDSLRRRADDAKPTGVMLSGGVDSSLLTAGLARWVGAPVEAFTFRYEGYEGELNEYDRARLLTRHLGVPHHVLPMGPAWVAEHLESLVDQYEEPFTYGLHTARLELVRARGIDVVLAGGLPGFPSNWELPRTERLALHAMKYSAAARNGLSRLANTFGTSGPRVLDRMRAFARLAGGSIPDLYEQKGVNTIVRDAKRLRVYSDPDLFLAGKRARRALMEERLADAESADPFDRLSFLGSGFLPVEHIAWWNHRWGRANGIRFRHPYFDLATVEFLARLPRADAGKRLMREVAATAMPPEIATYKKLAQAAPIWLWLQHPSIKELVYADLTRGSLEEMGIFRADVVLQMVEEHMRSEVWHPWLLWTLLGYSIWRRRFIGGAAIDSASAPPRVLAS